MFDNFSKVYVSVEDLAVRFMHVDPDRLLFMFDERILIFLKSNSFYLPSVKTPKMAANPLKKTKIRRYTTEVPAFRPFFQRYGWTLCISILFLPFFDHLCSQTKMQQLKNDFPMELSVIKFQAWPI